MNPDLVRILLLKFANFLQNPPAFSIKDVEDFINHKPELPQITVQKVTNCCLWCGTTIPSSGGENVPHRCWIE